MPASVSYRFAERVRAAVPEPLEPALLPLLKVLEEITAQIEDYDGKIEALAEQRYRPTCWLKQVPGVGTLTALTFVLTVGEPARFAHSRDVSPFLGLVPAAAGSRASPIRICALQNAANRYLRVCWCSARM